MGVGHEEERPEEVDDTADRENEEGGAEGDPSFIHHLRRREREMDKQSHQWIAIK